MKKANKVAMWACTPQMLALLSPWRWRQLHCTPCPVPLLCLSPSLFLLSHSTGHQACLTFGSSQTGKQLPHCLNEQRWRTRCGVLLCLTNSFSLSPLTSSTPTPFFSVFPHPLLCSKLGSWRRREQRTSRQRSRRTRSGRRGTRQSIWRRAPHSAGTWGSLIEWQTSRGRQAVCMHRQGAWQQVGRA